MVYEGGSEARDMHNRSEICDDLKEHIWQIILAACIWIYMVYSLIIGKRRSTQLMWYVKIYIYDPETPTIFLAKTLVSPCQPVAPGQEIKLLKLKLALHAFNIEFLAFYFGRPECWKYWNQYTHLVVFQKPTSLHKEPISGIIPLPEFQSTELAAVR